MSADPINALLFGYRIFHDADGIELPRRTRAQFVGLEATDDPVTGRTLITFSSGIMLAEATHLATGGKLAKRAIDGSCNFGPLTATTFEASGTAKADALEVTTGARTYRRLMPLNWRYTAGNWTEAETGEITNAASATTARIDPPLPNGATLTKAWIYVTGANPGRSAIPSGTDRLHFKLRYRAKSDGSLGTIGTSEIYDTSADVAAYTTRHAIEASGFTHLVDKVANRYTLIVKAETGSAYEAGLVVDAVEFQWTRAKLAEEL